ncbi:ThiF family adenylyltransferase [bacterium]|nr:ThiF family adenylyltransferase [bacterium]MCI0605471.1 ThiF family adenylyltransferase [bacterium]
MTLRLSHPDEDRYQRLRLIRWWDQTKLRGASALVVGAGALGNEVVKNLALLGLGNIWIIDFDRIETTNLTRSALFRAGDVQQWKAEVLAARAGELNPDCRTHALVRDARFDLGLSFLKGIDVIFGCLDNREARYYMNRNCYLLKKIYIDGGLDTLNGSVTVFHPPETACYECTLGSADRQELQKRISCLKSTDPEIKQHVPTAPTIASIVGGLQVQIGVRALHGLHIPTGKRLGLYGLSDVFFDMKLEISNECGLHSWGDPLPDSIEKLKIPAESSLKQTLDHAREKWNAMFLSWEFDRDLTVQLNCTSCGASIDFVGTQSRYAGAAQCNCGGVLKQQTVTGYTGEEPWGSKSFLELGFPEEHIYAAETTKGRVYFIL